MVLRHIRNLLFQNSPKARVRICFLILAFPFAYYSQIANYISNGSFEQKYDCNAPYKLYKIKSWLAIDSATSFAGLHHSFCNGNAPLNFNTYQFPRTGGTYIGTTFYYPNVYDSRGYLKNRLKAPLQSGITYCVKFYVNIMNTTTYGTDGFGIYFGDNTIDTITKCQRPLSYLNPQVKNPQGNVLVDTLGWTLITGTFVATGSEKYAIVGNFTANGAVDSLLVNPSNLPMVFTDVCIDDVSCIPLNLPAYAAAGVSSFEWTN